MAQFKIMPHNLEAEQAILGCILIDVQLQAEIMSTLEEVDFYSDAHQNIFKSMLSVYQKNVPVDFVTLTNELEKKGALEKVGGIEYITFLTNAVPSAANYKFYSDIVKLLFVVSSTTFKPVTLASAPPVNLYVGAKL